MRGGDEKRARCERSRAGILYTHTHPLTRFPLTLFTLQLAADGLAAGFLDLGLQPGDTIAAWLPVDDADLVSEGRDD